MIEFIIPLSLPLRGIFLTESPGEAPPRIVAEWDRRKRRASSSTVVANAAEIAAAFAPLESDPAMAAEPVLVTSPERHQVQNSELQKLQEQQQLFQSACNQLKAAAEQFDAKIMRVTHDLEVLAVELAEAIASKLVFGEIASNRFPIANLVHEVIGRLDTKASAVVSLNPADLESLMQAQTIQDDAENQRLKFVGDSSLKRGDCKATAGEISVVYELRRQIDEIRRRVLCDVDSETTDRTTNLTS